MVTGAAVRNARVQVRVTSSHRAARQRLRTFVCFLSPRADFDDTATYSAVATNAHGQVSTNAAVVVRSESTPRGGVGGGAWAPVSPGCAHPALSQGFEGRRSRCIPWDSRLDVSRLFSFLGREMYCDVACNYENYFFEVKSFFSESPKGSPGSLWPVSVC